MASMSTEITQWYETLKSQALDRNEQSAATWSKYKHDLETTKYLLSSIPQKMKHNVMVPIGPKALMRGTIVHTNEFLVNLGEAWFVKKTAHQTIQVCDRRIKSCDEMLERLEKERELIVNKSTLPAEHEAFGNEDRPEIIEYVTEEENEDWKKQHKIREKEYRQKLAELRNKEKKSIETEEDLWKHLDELELQEELEDELNRLNAECSSGDDVSEDNTESVGSAEQENQNMEQTKEEKSNTETKTVKSKHKVSFACVSDSSDDEPLRLEIKHSNQEPAPSDPNSEEINSPADIFNQYLKLVNKMPLSVLKNKTDVNKHNNFDSIPNYETDDDEEQEDDHKGNPTLFTGVQLSDVSERRPSQENNKKVVDNKIRKVSKFRISRNKSG